jgi:DNA-directed RNA polymerase specialized sigma24 family protein
MANRKFFTGDTVMLTHPSYHKHHHHTALVTDTRRTRYLSRDLSVVTYRVACECGKTLVPGAHQMNLVTDTRPSIDNLRRQYFLNEVGLHSDPATLQQQVDAALGILNKKHRQIIVRRFGLDGESGQTFQAIADDMGLTKQSIQQTGIRALRKLRSFPGLYQQSQQNGETQYE